MFLATPEIPTRFPQLNPQSPRLMQWSTILGMQPGVRRPLPRFAGRLEIRKMPREKKEKKEIKQKRAVKLRNEVTQPRMTTVGAGQSCSKALQ